MSNLTKQRKKISKSSFEAFHTDAELLNIHINEEDRLKEKYYGKVVLTMEAGLIVHIEKQESIKPK